MFLKLTDNETGQDVYLNPNHIIRFIANTAGEGTIIYMAADACVSPRGEAQLIEVHESVDEVFRLICKAEHPGKQAGATRGLI